MGKVNTNFLALLLKGRRVQKKGNKRLKKQWKAEYSNRINLHARQQNQRIMIIKESEK